ncbi:MAG: MFS transporter [Candidatus Aminicenantes bacterium]|nr:MFS transporter [Candidatus Aminicenantes bacterium]
MHARIHFVNFIRKFTFLSVIFLFPLHFLKLGFSGWQIGFILAVFAAAPLVVSFPTGWINDRLSMAGVIRGALLAQGLLLVLAALVRTFPLMTAVYLLLGMANNVLDVSLQSLYYKDEKAMDENRKFGAYNFWMGFGPALGVVAGGLLTKAAGFETVLIANGAVTILAFLAVGSFDRQKFQAVSFRDYRRDIFRGKTLLFIVFLFVLALHWSVEGSVYSPFLERNLGLGPFLTSAYIGGGLVVLAFSSLLFGRVGFNPLLNKRLMFASMFFSGAGLVLMTLRPPAVSFLFRLLHETSDGLMGVTIAVFISRLFERRTIGGCAGVVLSIQILGQMTGSLVFAPLGYRFGLEYPFIIGGSLLAANALYGALAFRRMEY